MRWHLLSACYRIAATYPESIANDARHHPVARVPVMPEKSYPIVEVIFADGSTRTEHDMHTVSKNRHRSIFAANEQLVSTAVA